MYFVSSTTNGDFLRGMREAGLYIKSSGRARLLPLVEREIVLNVNFKREG